jgi:hypothetical protein
LRNQCFAAAAFALIFAVANLFSPDHPIVSGVLSFLILGALAFVVLRWGILALATALLVSSLIGSAPIPSSCVQQARRKPGCKRDFELP